MNRENDKPVLLAEYITLFFDGNKSKFARAQGVKNPQVYQWIDKGFFVVNHQLCAVRRELKPCQ